MNRINVLRKIASPGDSVAWGTKQLATAVSGDIHAYVFAAVLLICSVTVGCSSDKPQTVSSNNQTPVMQPQPVAEVQPTPAPVPAPNKPVQKKAPRKPATVNYTDQTYGVTFEYPRRYAIETGNAATELLMSNPIPMNFVQPGGIALAAVELPETSFANTDFSSAFFNVSVNKTLTQDQCGEFAVPEPKPMPKSDAAAPSAATDVAKQDSSVPVSETKSDAKSDVQSAPGPDAAKPAIVSSTEQPSNSKLLLGDMELRATEAVSGEGTRQSDSKYFHVYQNGACYEFGLNVTTVASSDGLIKHVDRDRVFSRLEKILGTVKINPIAQPEVTAETPAPTVSANPAQ